MSLVVCIVAISPMRRESNHRSEMVTQLLLGEFAEVLGETKDFIQVRGLYDGYEGWCQRNQLVQVEKEIVTTRYINAATDTVYINDTPCRISIGTPLFWGGTRLGNYAIEYKEAAMVDATGNAFNKENIFYLTNQYLNTPYLWGGKSIFGIDCSGFTQQVYKLLNKHLPRDAWQQAELGEVVGFLQEVQCGDLAFFDNEEGRITHVGIMLNTEEIIHAAGRVRIDKIDNQGIINSNTGERTHRLRIVKRYA